MKDKLFKDGWDLFFECCTERKSDFTDESVSDEDKPINLKNKGRISLDPQGRDTSSMKIRGKQRGKYTD